MAFAKHRSGVLSNGHECEHPFNEQLDGVEIRYLSDATGRPFVTLLVATKANVSLLRWLSRQRAWVNGTLPREGALLFRGFEVTRWTLPELVAVLGARPFEYVERSSPRLPVLPGVYTSTEYPAHQEIALHSESSYAHVFPRKLAFMCERPAHRGGATTLADCRRVYQQLSSEVRESFRRRGVRYCRTLGLPVGLSWQEVFQTRDPACAENRCKEWGYQHEWLNPSVLRIEKVKAATSMVPETGETSWFNHVAFFHRSSMNELLLEELIRQFGENALPANVTFGDGGEIESSVVLEIRHAYESVALDLTWQRKDVLLVDNLVIAHGRRPYEGSRRILLSMMDATTTLD